MKYLWLSLAILALLLAACLGVDGALQTAAGRVEEPLRLAEAAARAHDLTAARTHADTAAALWKEQLSFFTSVLCHDETDVITVGFATLRELPEEQLLSQCTELLARLEHIREMDQLRLRNLL